VKFQGDVYLLFYLIKFSIYNCFWGSYSYIFYWLKELNFICVSYKILNVSIMKFLHSRACWKHFLIKNVTELSLEIDSPFLYQPYDLHNKWITEVQQFLRGFCFYYLKCTYSLNHECGHSQGVKHILKNCHASIIEKSKCTRYFNLNYTSFLNLVNFKKIENFL